jgi:hypothetical protein
LDLSLASLVVGLKFSVITPDGEKCLFSKCCYHEEAFRSSIKTVYETVEITWHVARSKEHIFSSFFYLQKGGTKITFERKYGRRQRYERDRPKRKKEMVMKIREKQFPAESQRIFFTSY